MEILFSAFLLSLVLVGIHAYFGLEIIRRGIIFTDLAVGQAAALGAAASLFFWDGRFLYGCSLLAALLVAFWIALASGRGRYPEAFIGLVYALGISPCSCCCPSRLTGRKNSNGCWSATFCMFHWIRWPGRPGCMP